MITIRKAIQELAVFIEKEARASIFAGSFLALLITSKFASVPGVARYDLLFFGAVLITTLLYLLRLETKDEVKMIAVFHVVGLMLEAFKTHPAIGSWTYPEDAITKIGTVPLYSGFMYAAVGSYIVHAWKILDLHISNFPHRQAIILASLAYLNFFTHHFIPDFRWPLIIGIFYVLRKSRVSFTVTGKYTISLALSFLLIAFFIWVAEDIGTLTGAWLYPEQVSAWKLVSVSKISSWFILVIISFVLITTTKQRKI